MCLKPIPHMHNKENKNKLTMNVVSASIKHFYTSIFARSNMFADAIADSITKSGYDGMEEFHEFIFDRVESEFESGDLSDFAISLMAKHVAENTSLQTMLFDREGVTVDDFNADFMEQYMALRPAFEEEVLMEVSGAISRGHTSEVEWVTSSTDDDAVLVYGADDTTGGLSDSVKLLERMFDSLLNGNPSDVDFVDMLTKFDCHILPSLDTMRRNIKIRIDENRDVTETPNLMDSVGTNVKLWKGNTIYTIIKEPFEDRSETSYTVIISDQTTGDQSIRSMTIGEIYDEFGYDMNNNH